jgi:ubiquinone/menaquinone biosynthesis C-methylase UbiE
MPDPPPAILRRMSGPQSDADLKAQLTAAWDRAADGYDATLRHGLLYDDEWRAWRRLLGALIGDARHSDVGARRILDVGTGTGVLALLAAELGHDVTGVDLSEGMLRQARSKAAANGLAIDWRTADAEALPADLVGFDAVLARHVLWTLPRPDRALASWRDAARAGGLVVVIDGVNVPAPWPLGAAQRLARHAATLLHARGDGHPADHGYTTEQRARLPLVGQRDVRTIAQLMRDAGLERVRVRATHELDRIERAHQPILERLGDPWRRYLATGRAPILTAA